jgi:peroxiredoxin-like protein
MMEDAHYYRVDVKWTADRKGTLSSPVLDNTVEVATPPEFDGGMAGVWSPEHLFVASVSSCLMTTFLAIAKYSKLEYLAFTAAATGKLEKVDGSFMISEIELRPVLEINDAKNEAKGIRIIEKAEAACLISNSIKTNIVLSPQVIVRNTALTE